MVFLCRFVSVPFREQVFVSIPGFVSIIMTWIFVALRDRSVCGLVPGPSLSPIRVREASVMNGGVATPNIWPSGGIDSESWRQALGFNTNTFEWRQRAVRDAFGKADQIIWSTLRFVVR